jgi:hypothetical protein
MTAPNQLGEFLRARRSRLHTPGSRDHDAMTLLSMITNGEQTPGRLPSPERPSA